MPTEHEMEPGSSLEVFETICNVMSMTFPRLHVIVTPEQWRSMATVAKDIPWRVQDQERIRYDIRQMVLGFIIETAAGTIDQLQRFREIDRRQYEENRRERDQQVQGLEARLATMTQERDKYRSNAEVYLQRIGELDANGKKAQTELSEKLAAFQAGRLSIDEAHKQTEALKDIEKLDGSTMSPGGPPIGEPVTFEGLAKEQKAKPKLSAYLEEKLVDHIMGQEQTANAFRDLLSGGKLILSENAHQVLLALAGKGKGDPLHHMFIAEAGLAVVALLLRKNADYGSSVFRSPMLAKDLPAASAIRVRLSDKLERIIQLAGSGKEPNVIAESLQDSLDDYCGYTILDKALQRLEAYQKATE